MTAKKTIEKLIADLLERRGQTIQALHQEHPATIDWFWETLASEYLLLSAGNQPDADPRYRFDTEWQEFWDIVQDLYPQYILKPVCVKS